MSAVRIIAAVPFVALFITLTFTGNVNAQGSDTGTAREQANCGLYEYRADTRRVVDGDTVDVDIDLGFNVWLRNERLRLYGIDTPELKGANKAAGLAAKNALIERCAASRCAYAL